MTLSPALRTLLGGAATPAGLRALASYAAVEAGLAAGRLSRRAPPESRLHPGPLALSGFFGGVAGVSRGARATAEALEQAGLPVIRHEIAPMIASRAFSPAHLPGGPRGVWIQHCNVPESDRLFSHIPRAEAQGRYRIGYWAWELARLPPAWRTAARAFHEIWVPSAFSAEGLKGLDVAVRVMPHPLRATSPAPADRRAFGIPEDAVAFGVYADARSTLSRKNPLGAVEAYQRAFPQPKGTSFLSVKIVAPEADPHGMAALIRAAAGREDIRIWSERLSDGDMAVYLASLDAVVSLHRAEGFGLTLAEALLAGKPVIATHWSGSLDVTTGQPGYHPVPARLATVRDPTGVYRRAQWADPDLDAAAAALRQVADNVRQGSSSPEDAIARLEERLWAPWRREALEGTRWRGLVAPA